MSKMSATQPSSQCVKFTDIKTIFAIRSYFLYAVMHNQAESNSSSTPLHAISTLPVLSLYLSLGLPNGLYVTLGKSSIFHSVQILRLFHAIFSELYHL